MMDVEQISALYKSRLESMGLLFGAMREVRDVYNGDVVLPMPEVSEEEKPAVANLTQQGLDQLSRRMASVMPNLIYPPLRQGFREHDDRARMRKMVNSGWWADNRLKRKLGLRARHWLGYASSPCIIRPDAKTGIPTWFVRSPLDCFPAPGQPTDMTPDDCVFTTKRTLKWLRENYPQAAMHVHKVGEVRNDMEFTVLEYVDAEEVVMVLQGHDPNGYQTPLPGSMAVELERAPNRAGVCWAVVPGRITLDRPLGHFDGILGMYQTQAALMAMEVIATKRAIWPREWVLNNPNGSAQIVQTPDPAAGVPGIIQDGTIERQQLDPTFRADQVQDRLEYAQRQSAGLPAELGGMGSTNIRTGRRGAQVLGAAIDFTIAEAQDIFAEALTEENLRAIEIDKAYFPTHKSYFISSRGLYAKVDYTPGDLWEADDKGRVPHVVEFPMAGTDAETLVLTGGQRLGMETVSRRTFMEWDPMIADAEVELDRLKVEGVERAFYAKLQADAANPDSPGALALPHFARLAKAVASGEKEWWDVVIELQEEVQAEQAEPVDAMDPAAMPGLAAPGQGAESLAAVPESEPSLQNLTALLSQLGTSQMAMRSRGAA